MESAAPPRKRRRTLAQGRDIKEVLLSGLAGGIAGCVAKTCVAPFDRVKILFVYESVLWQFGAGLLTTEFQQTGEPQYAKYAGNFTGVFRACANIFRLDGMPGLLQGHSITLLRIFPYAAIKFMAYEEFHSLLMPTPSAETSPRLFVAGSLAGITSVLFTYPLELFRVRLAYETRHASEGRISLPDMLRKIYHEGDLPRPQQPPPAPMTTGATALPAQSLPSTPSLAKPLFDHMPVLKFYRGFSVSIVGMIPYAGVSFLVWGRLRSAVTAHLPPETVRRNRTVLDLACGAVAGAMSQTASYPFEVIRRRMQVGGLLRPDRLVGFWETLGRVYRQNGWRGLFVGLTIGYIKVVPMTAVSYATWQACKHAFGVVDY